MTRPLSSRERIQRLLQGELPDRPPVALWRHFPVDDQDVRGLAESHVHFAQTYGWDVLKVSPAATYPLTAWGLQDEWQGDVWGRRSIVHHPIQHPEDWTRLSIPNPHHGALGMTLQALSAITEALGPEVPVLQTLFSPLIQAKYLVGEETLLIHLRRNPDALLEGLERITQATLVYLDALRRTGIAGVFYAIQHAQYAWLSEEEYRRFGRPFDLILLQYAREHFWLLMLHLHGQNIMFHLFTDYPVDIWHWHDRETRPSLSEALQQVPGIVCGGLRRDTLLLGTPDDVLAEAREAFVETQGQRWMLGTGCVLALTTPEGNLRAARRAVESLMGEA